MGKYIYVFHYRLVDQSTGKYLSKENLKKLKIKEKYELRTLRKKNIRFYIIVRKENVSLLKC